MRPVLLFPLLALVPAAPLLAETAPADCATLIDSMGFFIVGPDAEISDIAGGCRASGVEVNTNEPLSYRVGELTMRAPALFESPGSWRFPPEAEIVLRDIAIVPRTSMGGLYDYIIEMQSEPFDADLSYRWDSETGALDLFNLSVSDAFWGEIALEARLEDVAGVEEFLNNPLSLLTSKIVRVRATIENRPFFTNMVAVPLVMALDLDPEADPRLDIADYQRTLTALVNALPPEAADPESQAVMTRFIAEFPRPEGTYQVEIAFDPALGLDDFMVENPLELAGLLARFSLTAAHTPFERRR